MSNDTIEKIEKIFTKLNIKEFYFVDDNVFENEDEKINFVIGKLIAIYLGRNKDKMLEFMSKHIENIDSVRDEDMLKDFFRDGWKKLDIDEKEKIIEYLNTLLKDNNEMLDTINIPRILTLLDKMSNFKVLGPDEWNSDKKVILGRAKKTHRILILFDEMLEGSSKKGIDLATEVVKKPKNTVYCGLLSNKIIYNQELEYLKKIKDKGHIYPLAKERLSDIDDFINGIKRVVLNCHCDELRKEFKKIIPKIDKKTISKLDEINIADFDQIVFRSSFIEGVLEMDTLLEIYHLYHKKIARKEIRLNTKIKNISKLLRSLSDIAPSKNDEFNKAFEIEKMKRYEECDYINSNSMPIDTGDIFEIEGEKFILVSQPCDVILRNDGKRNLKNALLLKLFQDGIPNLMRIEKCIKDMKKKIEDTDKDELSKKLDEFQNDMKRLVNHGKFHNVEHLEDIRKLHHLKFTETCIISFNILDMCVFNDKGEAIFNTKNIPPENLTDGWKNRYEKLKKYFNEIKSPEEAIKLVIDNKEILFSLKINGSNKELKYGIKRIGHLNKNYCSDIITKYAHHISRVDLEHDFTRV